MNYEFKRVYRKGSLKSGRYIVLYTLKNRYDNNRLGITTSKKVGKSVKRNRFRRIIKENYRLLELNVNTGYDLVFVARSVDKLPTFNELGKEMKYLLKNQGVL